MGKEPHKNNEKYYSLDPTTEQSVNKFLQMNGAGIVLKDPQYFHTKEKTRVVFEYVIEGEGYIDYGDEHYTVQKGDCIILNYDAGKQIELSYGSSNEKPYLKIWFGANGKFVKAMLNAFKITSPVTIVKCNALAAFQKFVLPLSKDGADTLAAMLVIEEILYIMTNPEKNADIEADDFDALVDIYIKNNIQYMPPLAVIAEDIGMDAKSFGRYFKQRFQESYKHYMRRQRLFYAREMLKNKERSIAEVATYFGFCDQSYFSHCFYNEFGVYPNDYRKNKL